MSGEAKDSKQEAMDGSPALIVDDKGFINIKFQLGPIREVGINGTTIERVVRILINRLKGFQKGPFRCRENAMAITKLEEAIMWMGERTNKRVAQGVEGTNVAHKE